MCTYQTNIMFFHIEIFDASSGRKKRRRKSESEYTHNIFKRKNNIIPKIIHPLDIKFTYDPNWIFDVIFMYFSICTDRISLRPHSICYFIERRQVMWNDKLEITFVLGKHILNVFLICGWNNFIQKYLKYCIFCQ